MVNLFRKFIFFFLIVTFFLPFSNLLAKEIPIIVIAPSKKGAKNITKNLLLSKEIKLKSSLLIN